MHQSIFAPPFCILYIVERWCFVVGQGESRECKTERVFVYFIVSAKLSFLRQPLFFSTFLGRSLTTPSSKFYGCWKALNHVVVKSIFLWKLVLRAAALLYTATFFQRLFTLNIWGWETGLSFCGDGKRYRETKYRYHNIGNLSIECQMLRENATRFVGMENGITLNDDEPS